MRWIPPRLCLALARGLGRMAYFVDGRHRRIALRNLELVFAERYSLGQRRRIARRSFESFAMTIVEGMLLPKLLATGALRRQLRLGGNCREFLKRIEAKQPMLLLSAHLGSWEVLVGALAMLDVPTISVMRPMKDPAVTQWLTQQRKSTGQELTDKKGAVRNIRRALDRGLSVGLLVDQHDRKGVTVSFLGRQTPTTSGPATLSHRYQLPIYVGFVERRVPGRDYQLRVCGPLTPEAEVPKSPEQQRQRVQQTVQRYTRILDGFIRQCPDQWFWLHRRFKYDAGGNPYEG